MKIKFSALTLRTFLFAFGIIVSLGSCELINPEDEIPAYLEISNITLNVDPGSQGTASHKLTDAWVFIDNDIQGIYELPAKIPVLESGIHTVKIIAGIQENGIASSRLFYPFLNGYEIDIDLRPGQISKVNPVVTYFSTTKFSLLEDFEDAGIKFEKSSRSDTTLQIATDPNVVFEGNACGVAYLDLTKQLFEVQTIANYTLPRQGSPIFLELNYKTNNTFTFGIYANEITQSVRLSTGVFLNPTTEWKKAYINLTEVITNAPSAIDFKIFIGAIRDENVNFPVIYIDNIKLVHL